MLKTLLILGVAIFLLACGKAVLAKKGDKYIWLEDHSSYPNTKPYWKKNELEYKTYFGKYTYFNDHFNDYYGDPLGPVVAIWSVTRYLGDKPKFKECIDPTAPSEIAKKLGFDSPEYKKAKKEHSKLYAEYNKCYFEDNAAIEKKSKTITYYYARSTNNYLPLLPKRPENHGVYEIHVSFGPMGGILSSEGLTEKQKAGANQLDSEPCHRYGKDTRCYRLPGEDSHLYYTVRSILTNKQIEKGKVSSPWKRTIRIRKEVHKWEEVKGIEITKEQHDYMKTRCEGVFSCYLDDKGPNLTSKQKEYIKATAWELDTDVDARNALIKKAEKYRAE